jgi:hypothetical protein
MKNDNVKRLFNIDAKTLNLAELHCLNKIEDALTELHNDGYPGGLIAWALHMADIGWWRDEAELFGEVQKELSTSAPKARTSES